MMRQPADVDANRFALVEILHEQGSAVVADVHDPLTVSRDRDVPVVAGHGEGALGRWRQHQARDGGW